MGRKDYYVVFTEEDMESIKKQKTHFIQLWGYEKYNYILKEKRYPDKYDKDTAISYAEDCSHNFLYPKVVFDDSNLVEKVRFDLDYDNYNNHSIDKSNLTTDYLKQYLKDVYLLEKELYCSQKAEEKLNYIIEPLGKKPYPFYDGKNGVHELSSYGFDEFIHDIILSVLYGILGLLAGGVLGLFFGKLFFAIIGFAIAFVCGFIHFMNDSKNIIASSNKHYYETLEHDKKMEKEKALATTYRQNKSLYNQTANACVKTLKELYDMNIIFPKYRNLVAISQIYEYFMSGRCTQLEGHEGAYNIFESELRQNIIINKLNDVLNQLEQIKQNQYMIYQAIQEANLHLAQIESNTEAIKYNTAVTAENSAICARYIQ